MDKPIHEREHNDCQKVTWSMLIGVTNSHHQTKQRLCVNRNVSLFFCVAKIATVRLAVEVLHNKALTPGQVTNWPS